MPIEVNLVQGGIGLEVVASRIVDGRQIIQALEAAYATKEISRIRYRLIDRTDCTEYRVTSDEVRLIARMDQRLAHANPRVYMLFVAATPLQYGMTRVWQAYTDSAGFPRELLADRAGAEAWLKENISGFEEEAD